MPPRSCAADDKAAGSTSHDVCDACRPKVVRATREQLQLVLDCEECLTQLELDGVCPKCQIGHDGARCSYCGRHKFHRADCETVQPPPVEVLIARDDAGQRFTSDDCTAYLRGLGCEPLPGSVGL